MRSILVGANELLGAEERAEALESLGQPGRVAPGAEQLERPCLAVETRLGPSDDPVADEQGQNVVAVLALRLRDVHLQPIVEFEERFRTVSVVHESVEWREKRDPVRN